MKENRGPGRFCATVGISAAVTAGFGWLEVLLGWSIGGILRCLMPNEIPGCGKRRSWTVLTLGTVILAGVIIGAEWAFPEDGTFPVVSLGMLLLLYRTRIGEKGTGAMVSNVLGLILVGLVGVVLLPGFGPGEPAEWIPTAFSWREVWITAVITAPWWTEQGDWLWYGGAAAGALGFSLLCQWALGSALTQWETMPLYGAVQTVEILGVLQRMEAVVPSMVLLGCYGMMNEVTTWMEKALPPGERKTRWGIVISIAFCLAWGYRGMHRSLQEWIGTVFWGLIPVYALLVVFSGKMKKVLDKTGEME